MTEDEYLMVTNLARVRAATEIMRSVGDIGTIRPWVQPVFTALGRLESELADRLSVDP